MSQKIENVIIIGSGPAGYTAALYTSRADLEPLVFEGFQWGGLLQQTTDVENYPGYPKGVMGPEMMQDLRDQAERFGTRFVTDDVTRVELSDDGGIHKVYVGDEEHLAKAVILAMGANPKKLGVEGEDALASKGVSYCATCDAAFFRDKPTLVVGGGDTAMEDATFLAKFAKDVKIINRRDEFRASKIMLQRAEDTENIELVTPYVIDSFQPGENGSLNTRGPARGERRRRADARDRRRLHRDRPRAELRDRRGSDRHRRRGLRPRRRAHDEDEPGGRFRRRRPRRPRLPPGRDRGRLRLRLRPGRRGLSARHAAGRRGPLGFGPGEDRGGRRGRRRGRRAVAAIP